MFIPESRVGSLNCNTIHTAWMVKFVINLVLSTLFLSVKWSITPNSTLKFGVVDHFMDKNRADNTNTN